MDIFPIATFRSPFKSKFGIPKQSGLVAELEGEVVLLPKYSDDNFVRGLEGFDHLWIIWQFSTNSHVPASPLVRPPLLGGNEKMGVFATRSPYRPNAIGLSSVRLISIDSRQGGHERVLRVLGADMQDGTPIFDIKPYLPYTDSHATSRAGFVDDHPIARLKVVMTSEVEKCLDEKTRMVLRQVLELDPRPHYHDDETKIYGFPFQQYDVKFRVSGDICTIVGCDLLDHDTP